MAIICPQTAIERSTISCRTPASSVAGSARSPEFTSIASVKKRPAHAGLHCFRDDVVYFERIHLTKSFASSGLEFYRSAGRASNAERRRPLLSAHEAIGGFSVLCCPVTRRLGHVDLRQGSSKGSPLSSPKLPRCGQAGGQDNAPPTLARVHPGRRRCVRGSRGDVNCDAERTRCGRRDTGSQRDLPRLPRRQGRQGRWREVDRRRRFDVRKVGARRIEARVHRLPRRRLREDSCRTPRSSSRSTAETATTSRSRSTPARCTAWPARAEAPPPRPASIATASTTSCAARTRPRAPVMQSSRRPAASATPTRRWCARPRCRAATSAPSSTTASTDAHWRARRAAPHRPAPTAMARTASARSPIR